MTILPALLIILLATAGGYLFASFFIGFIFRDQKILGLKIPGLMPTAMPAMAGFISDELKAKVSSNDMVQNAMLDPGVMQELKPELEEHIDAFLKNKLPKAIPLLAGMMGEKTTNILKAAFLEEVETLFPEVMKSVSAKAKTLEFSEKKLLEIFTHLDFSNIEKKIKKHARLNLLLFKLACSLCGALIGALQVLGLSFINY